MPAPGRQSHPSLKGPRPEPGPRPRPRGRGTNAAIVGTTVVAVLAVVVVVLAYRVGHRHNGPSVGEFSELEARVDELSGQVNGMQATVREAAQQAKAALAKASKTTPKTKPDPGLATCLSQIQREVDDLQAYLAYRTPPRRDRVSGACLRLLQPRFKG